VPATCYALFGAGLIVAMVVEAEPSLSVQSNAGGERQVQMKGAVPEVQWKRVKSLAQSGEARAAIAVYGALVANRNATARDVARAAAGMAGIYLIQGREKEALAMGVSRFKLTGRIRYLYGRCRRLRGLTGSHPRPKRPPAVRGVKQIFR